MKKNINLLRVSIFSIVAWFLLLTEAGVFFLEKILDTWISLILIYLFDPITRFFGISPVIIILTLEIYFIAAVLEKIITVLLHKQDLINK